MAVFVLTASGVVLAPSLGGSAGPWTGFAVATAAALIGGGTLWQQRGQLEQRVAELAKRRRSDLAQAAEAELRHRAEADRLRAELDHEQQYSTLVQEQLNRARRQLEDERAARRAAERELDALTTGSGWRVQTQQYARPAAPKPAAASAAESAAAATDRPFRPFMEHVASVSEAALAMAPVIEPAPAADAVLDLTAYDETLEFAVRDVRGGVA
jgi:hypothetical protein